MAITIDQFLRDLSESQGLSDEELSAFRRELAALAPESAADRSGPKNGSPSGSLTKTEAAPLVLCDCLVREKVEGGADHWVFAGLRLEDDAPVTIHLLVPEEEAGPKSARPSRNGAPQKAGIVARGPVRITRVGRCGEMVCLCCESIQAESLSDLVDQHGYLPLELATETLLEVVRTLKEIQNLGLELQSVSADQLLLDDDGRIHVSGHEPASLQLTSAWTNEAALPSTRLLASLGELYEFLQTGGKADSIADQDSAPAVFASSRIVSSRLAMKNGSLAYKRWEELLRDLEALRDGGEVSGPGEIPQPAESSKSSESPAGSKGGWMAIAVAVLAAAAFVAWSVFAK